MKTIKWKTMTPSSAQAGIQVDEAIRYAGARGLVTD